MPSRAQCPACEARFLLTDTSGGSWRCAVCDAAVISGGATVRWLYPLSPAADPSSGLTGVTAATAATAAGHTLSVDELGSLDSPAQGRMIGRYEVRGELGRGGMGVVYSAWDPELHRAVAVKVLTAGRFASGNALARFIGEARAAASLDHPGIVRVNDLGTVDDQPFFTMEQVEGPSLEAVLAACGPLRIPEAARIIEIVSRATQHAHDAGVAHRDLKPANVLLTCEGYPRVTDFGLAKSLDIEHHLTATEQILGTPAFMAPEVARAERAIAWPLTDVYGLGALLYAALTESPPSRGASLAQTLDAAAQGRRTPLKTLRPDAPDALVAVVDRALRPEPERRYPTAGALADDLARFLSGEAVQTRPEGLSERGARWARRRRRLLIVGAIGAVGVAAALVVPKAREHQDRTARESAAAAAWTVTSGRIAEADVDGNDAISDAMFRAFVEAPIYTGTGAVADAWLARGDAVAPEPRSWLGEPDDRAVALWAQAILAAPDEARLARALLRMTRWQLETGRADDLGPLLEALERFGGSELAPEIDALRLRWALRAGQLTVAAAAWERAAARGQPEGVGFVDPSLLAGLGDAARALGNIGGDAGDDAGDESRGDVDGDGVSEGYIARYGEGLVRVDDGGESLLGSEAGVTVTPDIRDVAVADLDGDGADELAVVSGGWRSYDLRVLEADGEGGLRQRTRRRRGAAMAAAALPDPWRPGEHLLVSWETDQYANVEVFGARAPRGPAAGLLIHRLEGDALREIFFLPTHADRVDELHIVDLDGDGLDEVAAILDAGPLALWTGASPDTFAVARWAPADAALPPARAILPPPAALAGAPMGDAWDALQAMQASGLLVQSAEALERLAELSEAEVSVAASAAAADLWTEAGRPDRAAVAWEASARSAPTEDARRAWARAVASWLEAADPARALDVAHRWTRIDGEGPSGALAETLSGWAGSQERSLSFAAGAIHPSWRIEEPLALSERAGTLHVDMMNGDRPLARLPLRWGEGPLALAVDLRVDRLEPGSGLGLRLDGDSTSPSFELSVVGGGGLSRAMAACALDGKRAPLEGGLLDEDAPELVLRLRLTWAPDPGAWTCAVAFPESDRLRAIGWAGAPPSPALELTLQEASGAVGFWMGGAIERLEIWGVEAAPPSESVAHRANMALVRRQPDVALALLPEDAALPRALALAQMGRVSQTVEALRGVDRAALDRRAAHMLRAHRETWAPLLRDALDEDFVSLFEQVWSDDYPLNATWTQEALFEDLAGLDLLARSPSLGASRAIALLESGQINQGTQEALAWLIRWSMLSPEQSAPLRTQAARIHLALALEAAESGADSRARRHASESASISPYPELILDQLASSGVWRARGLPLPAPK